MPSRLLLAALLACTTAFAAEPPTDPLFDLAAIYQDPVDATTLASETVDGVVFETIEFTSRVVDGQPERVQGILALPVGAQRVPGVFWSMGGMAPAGREFPGRLARQGYACLAITLPHKIRNSHRVPFDTAHPERGNLALLARDQLRGVTVLAQRPEVDPDRLGVAGASYGGVFASMLAGIDPRLKAGFSFFGGGNHALGTSLPQFCKMATLEDVAVWNRTIDPALRLRQRDIPFYWGIAVNDHWFHFPAVVKTFTELPGTAKRAAIVPHWQHGFTPTIDDALLGFLNTTPIAPRPQPAYLAPGPVTLAVNGNQVTATFAWTGTRPVAKAELIASYGEDFNWLGWPQRAAMVFPATIAGQQATATLPIPSRKLPLIFWANLTDDQGVLTSSVPRTLAAADLATFPVTPQAALNCFLDGDLGAAAVEFYQRMGQPLAGEPDTAVKQAGTQSLRQTAPAAGQPAPKPFTVRLLHSVPGLGHRLSVQLRAERPAQLTVTLIPVRPAHWDSAVVKLLVAQDPRLAPLLPHWTDPVVPLSTTATVGPEWQEVTIAVPVPTAPVDGYRLEIAETPAGQTTWWVDTLVMQPLWPE
jgi:dienelactone hydrolase